ncbi:MAG TPA: hypothetical protein VIM96_03235 [Pseudomonadales bacterium]
MHTTRATFIANTLLWACVVFFVSGTFLRAVFFDYTDRDSGLMRDSFVYSVVAKNLANGLGWTTSGYESFPLNPEASTVGPTLVVPLAIAIHLFGNQLTTISMTIAGINLLLLAMLLIQIHRHWTTPVARALFVIPLIVLFISIYPHYWYRAIGEITSLLLLTNAAFLAACDRPPTHRRYLLIGLLAGLACTTKSLSILATTGLAITLLVDQFLRGHRTRQDGMRWLLMCLCMALPFVLFECYQAWIISTLDPDWWAATESYRHRLFARYSGLNTLKGYFIPGAFLQTLSQTFMAVVHLVLRDQFAVAAPLPWAAWLVWPFIFLMTSATALWQWKQYRLPVLILAMALPLLAWCFLLLTSTFPRYVYLGVSFGLLTIIALLPQLVSTRRSIIAAMALCALMLLCNPGTSGIAQLLSPVPTSLKTGLRFPVSESDFSRATYDIAHYIEQRGKQTIGMSGLAAVSGIEYLSPTPNVFFNPSDRIAHIIEIDETAYLEAYPEVAQWIAEGHYHNAREHFLDPDTPKHYLGKVKFIGQTEFDIMTMKDTPLPWKETGYLCNDLVYQNDFYLIEHCTDADLKRMIDLAGGLPFRPQAWLRPTLIYPTEHEFF